MIVAYLLLMLLAILFKLMHWPGSSLFIVLSSLFPFLDIFIQLLRKKDDKVFRITSSLALFGFSVFLLFKMLFWPGAGFVFIFALLTSVPFLVLLFMKKFAGVRSKRYLYLALIACFSILLMLMKKSQQMELFLLEDPMDKNEHIPPFFLQNLAFACYNEGDRQKAENLIELAIEETKYRKEHEDYAAEWLERDLAALESDLQAIENHSWTQRSLLFY